MWASLLKLNKTNIIKLWINVQCGNEEYEFSDPDIDLVTVDTLKDMFTSYPITPELIMMISNNDLNILQETQESVLNEFSKFGIFSETEDSNLKCMLKRFIAIESIEDISNILTQINSSINVNDFHNFLIEFCLENNLHKVLNVCCQKFKFCPILSKSFRSKHVDLMLDFKTATRNFNDTSILFLNIFRVCKFLSDNVGNYLNSQPLIILCMFVLTENLNLKDILSNKISIKIDDFKFDRNVVKCCLDRFSLLNIVLNKIAAPQPHNSITIYDLLQQHADLNAKEVFSYRFDNTISLPHFKSAHLVESYGYKKKVNFMFHLRQHRPSVASKVFILHQLKQYGDVNDTDKMFVTMKACKFALRNFLSNEITASCVSFIEMINESSNVLKTHLKVARIIHESQKHTEKQILDLFDDVETNSSALLSILEEIQLKQLEDLVKALKFADRSRKGNNLLNGYQLVGIFKEHEVVLSFARIHNLKYPEMILKFLARQKMWLPFLLYVQLNNYSVNQVKKLIQSFKDYNLLEHISHSIVNDVAIDEQKEMYMKDRDSRKHFLSRIGVRQKIDSAGNVADNVGSSIISTSSSGSGTSLSSYTDFFENDMLDFRPNLLQVLIRCHNSSDPPKSLLHASQYYNNPVFAVLAASYEVELLAP